jgi:hypothetical protein
MNFHIKILTNMIALSYDFDYLNKPEIYIINEFIEISKYNLQT